METQSNQDRAPRGSKKKRGSAAVPIAVLVTFVGGVTTLAVHTCHRDASLRQNGDAFFSALREGDVDGAYSQLSAQRRAKMSREAFARFVDLPVFANHSEAGFYNVEDRAEGYCLGAHLETPDGEWNGQLFFVEEGDDMRVHGIAVQRPATMGLGTMLPECGFWRGTLVGYNGPPIERATQPTWKID